jgi:hypothetical protein
MGLKELIDKHGDKGLNKNGWFRGGYSSRSEEIAEEKLTSWADNGKACEGCIFACGNTSMDDSPNKGSCMIYAYPKTKPDSVFLEGQAGKYRKTGGEAVEIAKGSRADK